MNKWELRRNDNNEKIELTKGLHWVDEFDWSAVAQTAPAYTLTGAQDIQQGIKKAGRPITLKVDEHELLDRKDYLTLQAWASIIELEMTLIHQDSRQFSVIFRNHEKPIQCKPVFHEVPQEPTDKYMGTINLMTIN